MDDKSNYRKYLENQAIKKLEFIINHYEQSYRAYSVRRGNKKVKSAAMGIYFLIVLGIAVAVEILLYILKSIIIPSSMANLPIEILDILVVVSAVVFGVILFFMVVYICIQLYNVKKSQIYSGQNENNEGLYLAKLNRYRYIINNIDECSEEELNEIINIDCTNL